MAAVMLSCAPKPAPDAAETNLMRDSLTLYASFDETLDADLANGSNRLRTRYGALDNPGGFRFEDGYPQNVFRVAPEQGVHGGALEALDVLPENGRIFFPAQNNLAYDARGWSGTVSFWIKTNPDTMLKTPFCDPVQITEKGATNGGQQERHQRPARDRLLFPAERRVDGQRFLLQQGRPRQAEAAEI